MAPAWLRKLSALELEEKIFNGGLCIAIIGIFLPWIGGRPSLIDSTERTYTGLGFHTGFIGLAVLGLLAYTLLISVVPLTTGKPLVRRQRKAIVRLCASTLASVLTLAALSVLMKVTLDSPGMEIRFGVYTSLIGSLIGALYAFLAFQEEYRKQVQGMFHYPDQEEEPVQVEGQHAVQNEQVELFTPPPAPPPPAVEEHPTARPLSPR